AAGEIYSLQPGDTDYKRFPASAALKGGWGYWAFFPSGGSLQTAPGSTSYSVTLLPGQQALIGNPSATTLVSVNGAHSFPTYRPGEDYQNVPTIPVGQGAWVTGAGLIRVTTEQPPPSPAPAATAVGPSSVPSTATTERDAALQAQIESA